MESLSKVLGRLFNKNPELVSGIEEVKILACWETAVGPLIAKHARAVKLVMDALWVEVDHPIWKQELNSNKIVALSKMNQIIRVRLDLKAMAEDRVKELILVSPKPIEDQPKQQKRKRY